MKRCLSQEVNLGHSNSPIVDAFDNSADVKSFQRERILEKFREHGLPQLRHERFTKFLESRTFLHSFHKRVSTLEALKFTSTQWAYFLQRNYAGFEKVLLCSAQNVEARVSLLRTELGYTSFEIADLISRFPNILLGSPETLAERITAIQQVFPTEWKNELKASVSSYPKILMVRTTMPGDNFRFLAKHVWDSNDSAARAALIDNLQVLAKQPEHIVAAYKRCVAELGAESAKEMLRDSPRNLRWSLTTSDGKHTSASQVSYSSRSLLFQKTCVLAIENLRILKQPSMWCVALGHSVHTSSKSLCTRRPSHFWFL